MFVLSPDAIISDVGMREVSFAASLNKRFAPIVCRRVDDKDIPEALAKLNFIFFDDAARFDESADRLAEALNNDIAWISATMTSSKRHNTSVTKQVSGS